MIIFNSTKNTRRDQFNSNDFFLYQDRSPFLMTFGERIHDYSKLFYQKNTLQLKNNEKSISNQLVYHS